MPTLPIDHLLESFGPDLVRKGIIREEQLEEAETVRAELPYLRLGEVLLGLDYVKLSDYVKLLREHIEGLRLGDYLVLRRIVTPEQLQEGLDRHRESGKMLGHCLITLGHTTLPILQQALAEQRRLRRQGDGDA